MWVRLGINNPVTSINRKPLPALELKQLDEKTVIKCHQRWKWGRWVWPHDKSSGSCRRSCINCYKLPTFSEWVAEVDLFQGSTPSLETVPGVGPGHWTQAWRSGVPPWMRGLGPVPGPSELSFLPFTVQTTISYICYRGKRKRDKGESAYPMPGYQYSFWSSLLNAAQLLKLRLTPLASSTDLWWGLWDCFSTCVKSSIWSVEIPT